MPITGAEPQAHGGNWEPPRQQIGQFLVGQGLITPAQLDETLDLKRRWGTRIGDIVVAKGWLKREQLYQALATHLNTVYIDMESEPPDVELFVKDDAPLYSELLILPWAEIRGKIWVVAADPDERVYEFVRDKFGCDTVIAFASKFDILHQLHRLAGKQFNHTAVHGLSHIDPGHSASQVFTLPQLLSLYGMAAVSLFLIFAFPVEAVQTINAMLALYLLASFFFKFLLAWVGSDIRNDIKATDEEVKALDDQSLPLYTVLVPMYREPDVLPILAAALRRMDYPLSKLDIKLVLEEEDTETIAAAEALNLEGIFEIIRVPPAAIKTKPKACNFALHFSRGELLTIFDAEDKPEPDQLKKVVVAFRKSCAKTACIQARLNYYNWDENWLTRMFTLEYSLWFDFYLPALEALKVPIPLGGTSNHFKMDVLRQVNAWDPYNVTEDADLGTRLTQLGYRVGVVNSTTHEEANTSIPNWIRQRSRWIKGYMQTYLVHMRNPLQLYHSLGFVGFWGFQFFVGGTFITALITPLLYGMYVFWLITGTRLLDAVFPDAIQFPSIINLLVGNGFFIYVSVLGAFKRKLYGLMPWALTVPLYWIMMSIAGYKALWQLVYKPFFWEKTTHGLSKFSATERAEALKAQ
ncbi:MAG: glycosyltransferase family 2 protein [Bryobacteraceae bacterium]